MLKRIKEHFFRNINIYFDIVAFILIILMAISISPKTLQNDTYYTIKIGELITNNGIDMQDHFSWHENLQYTYPHWLYDFLMYQLYNIGGFDAIYISTCVLASILGILIYKINSKIVNNRILSFPITIGVMYLIRAYVAARAQLLTFILFITAIFLIERFLQTKKIRYGVGLVAISLLIANLHVAVWPFLFVLFMPYIADYLICLLAETVFYKKIGILYTKFKIKTSKKDEKISKYKEKLEKLQQKAEKIKENREKALQEPYKIKLEKNKNTKWLFVILIICVLMGFITPIGMTPFTYLYNTMQGNTTQNINEHLPLTLADNVPIMCTLVIVLTVMIFTKSKIKLADLFMLGGLTYLMFSSRRQASMLVLIGSLILNKMIYYLIEKYIKDVQKHRFQKVMALLLVAYTILTLVLCKDMYKGKDDDPYIRESTYPVQASEWILNNLDVKNIKLFNEYNYGSYLLYKGIPVFVDSRADLYAPEFNEGCSVFSDFINVSGISTYYGDIFKKYNITHVILYKNSKMNMMIKRADSDKYEELYSDKYFVIYKVL